MSEFRPWMSCLGGRSHEALFPIPLAPTFVVLLVIKMGQQGSIDPMDEVVAARGGFARAVARRACACAR